MQMVNSVVWDGELQGCFGQDPEKAKQMFLEHTEEVKRVRCRRLGHLPVHQ